MEEGKAPDTVKLISAEGHEFIVDRKAALVSGTIKSMLSGPGLLLFSKTFVFVNSWNRYFHWARTWWNLLPWNCHTNLGKSCAILLLQTQVHKQHERNPWVSHWTRDCSRVGMSFVSHHFRFSHFFLIVDGGQLFGCLNVHWCLYVTGGIFGRCTSAHS